MTFTLTRESGGNLWGVWAASAGAIMREVRIARRGSIVEHRGLAGNDLHVDEGVGRELVGGLGGERRGDHEGGEDREARQHSGSGRSGVTARPTRRRARPARWCWPG